MFHSEWLPHETDLDFGHRMLIVEPLRKIPQLLENLKISGPWQRKEFYEKLSIINNLMIEVDKKKQKAFIEKSQTDRILLLSSLS